MTTRTPAQGGSAIRRWLRRSRPHLRTVFLLSGSALAVAFAAIDIVAGSAFLTGGPTAFAILGLGLVTIVPPCLAALVPQVRLVEGAAATSLLGADLGGEPTESRTWSQRIRTMTWFWAHLLAGVVAGAAVMIGGVGAVLCVVTPLRGAGHTVLGAVTTTGTARDIWIVLAGPVLLAAALAVLGLVGEVLAQLAPGLLGPNPQERFAELDARTAHLVERTRLARELHDSVGHALSVVVLQSAAARRQLAVDPAAAMQSMTASADAARTALEELDAVLGLLRDDSAAAQRQPARDLAALPELARATRAAGHDLRVDGVVPSTLPAVVSREGYRIVQEGLTNALRHAPGQPVRVSLTVRIGEFAIAVDNPVVRAARWRRTGGGRGLAGVAERVRILGGSMTSGVADQRWRLDVRFPVPGLRPAAGSASLPSSTPPHRPQSRTRQEPTPITRSVR